MFFILCPNKECGELTLTVSLYDLNTNGASLPRSGDLIRLWRLVPESEAKVFPEYIPKQIIDDYVEACLIRDLSPKASATLSRRCLQGIIRDFWGVKKQRLIDEIDGIKDKIEPLTWEAIQAVRKIGNIGAHMEKDINLIIDVDPNEAQLLIGLIEILLKDWYVAKHQRQKTLEGIINISKTKEEQKLKKEG